MAFDNNQLTIEIAAKFLGGGAFQQAQASMETLRQSQDRLTAGMTQANSSFGVMATALRAIPFALVYQQVSLLHDSTVKLAASINDQSEALGLSTRHYQALQIAAQGAGIAEGQMAGILTTFNARIGEAVSGKKQAIEAFDRLGVKILDSQGKLRAEGAILQEVAGKLVAIKDVTERTARAKELLGIAGAKATAMLKDLALGYDALAQSGDRVGLIMDQQTIDTMAKLDRSSSDLTRTIQVLYAQLAAPIITTAIDAFTGALKKVKEALDDIGKSWTGLPDLLLRWWSLTPQGGFGQLSIPGFGQARDALRATIGGGGGQMQGLEARIAQLEKERADFMSSPAHGPNSAPVTLIDREIASIRAQIAAGREGARGGNIPWGPNQGASNPAVVSGGGGGQRDVLGALQAESRQLAAAYERVMGFSTETTQEMRDQADLADKIAKRLASALKDVPENDPRRAQIVALIDANERYRQGIEQRQRALKEAEAVEKRYGDGEREHAETIRRLDAALRDNLITQTAYEGAVRAANDALQAQRDRVAEAQDGFQGFFAGFASAERAYARTFSSFRTGAQLFTDSTQLMSDALIRFAQTGELSFKKLLGDFSSMLIQMGLRAAASEVFGWVGGLFKGGSTQSSGGIGGLLGGGSSGGGGGFFSGIFSAIGSLLGFAEGGRPPTDRPSIVGERGRELWWPDSAGTIYNQDQLAAMAGGGAPSVTIVQHIGQNVGAATRAELARMGAQAVEAARAAVYDSVRRGGSYAHAFR